MFQFSKTTPGGFEEFENIEVINAGQTAAQKFGFKLLESSLKQLRKVQQH